ncbi:alpha/beta hydrolase [Pseudolysinimonas sp.]|uniref:alpha/beta hydrolase n=1 Tax=Pseudolysinimonas sp. TaxID=2680009 RepID=UPI003F7DC5BB
MTEPNPAADRAGDVPIRWHASPGDAVPTLLWLHGGGFFRGALEQPEAHAVAVSLAGAGVAVATVDYRLAPVPGMPWPRRHAGRRRARFPLPLDDVLIAYRRIRARSPAGVVLGGASAGACLAAAAVLRARDEGHEPAGAMLAYGFFHAALPRVGAAGPRSRGHRRLTHMAWALDLANRSYAGSAAALTDPHAFPGGHLRDPFPRTLMIDAQHDVMRASGDRFAAELLGTGTDLERHVLPGTDHAFLNRPRDPAFAVAVSHIARWAWAPQGR